MRLRAPATGLRLPRRTLRAQLALLYAALFCASFAAVAAVAVIFKPDFLVRSGCRGALGTPGAPGPAARPRRSCPSPGRSATTPGRTWPA
jgi:hypothetical protein